MAFKFKNSTPFSMINEGKNDNTKTQSEPKRMSLAKPVVEGNVKLK
mgnify:CR=1 FL=1|jgi:hypothetical protein|tara:strand:+ start:154 stop:291 length:138 start_codon:yes stop_codon:yes gene_type:complete